MKLIEAVIKDKFNLLIDEGLFDEEKTKLTNKFLKFCCSELGLQKPFTCRIVEDREKNHITTTAYCTVGEGDPEIVIYGKNRLPVDIYRSVAHELTHRKQDEEGRIKDTASDGGDGSPIENEANAKAGEIIRKFGKKFPNIYY